MAFFWVFSLASNTECGSLEGRKTIDGGKLYISVDVVEKVYFSKSFLDGNEKPGKIDVEKDSTFYYAQA